MEVGVSRMKYYKLTDASYRTRDTQWGEGITHEALGDGNELCTSDVIHVYDHPLKAVLFNPIHANIEKPVLWEVKVRKVVASDGLKVGVKECTTVKQIPLPTITTEQRVRFAIYCALEVYNKPGFVRWAKGWLSGEDTSADAAEAAWTAAGAAAGAAGAAEAAWAAARAARASEASKDINFAKIIKKAMK